jgi:sigma-B regulation protein RsbU (phosphoserine phosphatase)
VQHFLVDESVELACSGALARQGKWGQKPARFTATRKRRREKSLICFWQVKIYPLSMKMSSQNKALLLAIIGIFGIVFYFYFITETQIYHIFLSHVSKSEILTKARQMYKDSPLADYDFPEKTEILLDENLARYLQTHSIDSTGMMSLPVAKLNVSWSGDIQMNEKKEEGLLKLSFDFYGNLTGFEKKFHHLLDFVNLNPATALINAKTFLNNSGIDTSTIELTKNVTDKEGQKTGYDFIFSSNHSQENTNNVTRSYEIQILGSTITKFETEFTLSKEVSKASSFEEISDITIGIISVIFWVIILVIMIAVFIKRVKHDELEFKRAVGLGILVAVIMFAAIGIQSWPQWEGVVIGGLFGGIFSGIGIVLLYPAAESFTRDFRPQKLEISDLLFRGYLRFKEFGNSILQAFFIAGISLFSFGVLIWMISKFNFGFIETTNETFEKFINQNYLASGFLTNIVHTLYVIIIFAAFFVSYLISKIKTKTALIISFIIIVQFCGIYSFIIKPTYIAFLTTIPIAILWAYFLYRYELIALTISFFIFISFVDLFFLPVIENGFSSLPGIVTIGILLLFFISGIFCSYSSKSVKEFENYVPEYISRIAEKERFLQELEIARSVQMKFLPQTMPDFPDLEIASICRPAMEIDGDYYDLIVGEKGTLSVVIGDVSGKGVSAAFYMTMAKGIIKTLAKKGLQPKALLSQANEIFYENAPRNVFISMIYGTFNMNEKILTFARAGHNPLLVRKKVYEKPDLLNPRGLAIGLDNGNKFSDIIEQQSIPLDSHDILLFYTDGISESMDKKGNEFGEERLRGIINEFANLSAQELLEKIVAEVDKFATKTTQHDDLTMVLVKVV